MGAGYLVICILVAILGYQIAPDHTRFANRQVVELASLPPGSDALILKVPQTFEHDHQSLEWLLGYDQDYVPIPLKDTASMQWNANFVSFVRYGGLKDSLSTRQFDGVSTISGLSERYMIRETFHMGTDQYGRDMLSRIILGARISISVGMLSMILSLLIGITLGGIGGYWGGWADRIILWLISVVWSVPALLMALAISFVLGKGFWQVFVAIGLSMWVDVARIIRGQILSTKEELFVEAGKALGFSDMRMLIRHVLPNVLSPIIVIGVANFGAAVLIESGLSFLGIGVEVPIPTWGRMIYEGYTYIVFETGKWLAFYPGLALIALVVSINLVGIGLRDALDVKM